MSAWGVIGRGELRILVGVQWGPQLGKEELTVDSEGLNNHKMENHKDSGPQKKEKNGGFTDKT